MDKPNTLKPHIETAYKAYSDMLYRVALAQLQSDEDAQDAVQDVFIKYISHSGSFKDEEHQRAWFLRVTVNVCRDMQRKHKVRRLFDESNSLSDTDVSDSGRYELFETLGLIPEKYKSVVILHCLEGLSIKETAEVLGISLSAAKMRLSRARDVLREEKHSV